MLRWRARIEHGKRPLCVSLWSGAGGLDLGLERAGYDIAVAADSDDWACQTHGYNSTALVHCRDLSDPEQTRSWLRGLELPPVALIAAGFPCQPYSRAGHSRIRQLVSNRKRARLDPRGLAWLSFVAAIEEVRPARVLAENVPDLVRFNEGRQLRDIVKAIENAGYEVDVRILPARVYGVPQYRERLFIQAVRDGGPIAWPEPPTEVDDSLLGAIGDLPPIDAGHQDDAIPYEPRSEPPSWAREGVAEAYSHLIFDHIVRDVREDDLEAFEQLPPGGTYLDVPPELRRYDDSQFTDKYKRLEWDSPSRTITAHIARDGYWYIHPSQHRSLSVREAARVQTFPDWFRFAGFPSNRLVQIGNAVPPLVGRALGVAMLAPSNAGAIRSLVPSAARLLQETAHEYWQTRGDWEILVREVVFNGRAGDDRLEAFLEGLPDANRAAGLRNATGPHEKRAKDLARRLAGAGGKLPDSPEAVQHITGAAAGVVQVVMAASRAGQPPRCAPTFRVAERVSGVTRDGSLNGVSHAVLARLADFGDDAAANQLLLDLGRSLCLQEDPLCNECPLRAACTFASGGGIEDQVSESSRDAPVPR